MTLQAISTTKGDVAAAKSIGSSNTAVWQSYTAIEDVTHHTAVSIPAQGNAFAFDRKTGVLVPWSGNSVNGKPVNLAGVTAQGSLFPIGTKKQDYQVFDTTLLKPVTFRYQGTGTINGVSTLRVRREHTAHAGRHGVTARLAGRHDGQRGDAARVLQRQGNLLRGPGDRRRYWPSCRRSTRRCRTAQVPPGWSCSTRTSRPRPRVCADLVKTDNSGEI